MKKINIAISSSSSYIKYVRVMMASLYSAHPDKNINLFLFYVDENVCLSEATLKKQSDKHHPENIVNFIKVDRNSLQKVDNHKGWAIDLWCRWYALDILSISCDRVLILGVDTFVRSDITDFYFQDMTGYYFACSPDLYVSNTPSSKWPAIKIDMDRTGFEDKKRYINGDVVLVNLEETHGKISFSEFLSLYSSNQFTCWDQDVINYCFSSHIKYQDPYMYNYFPNLNLKNVIDSENFNRVKILHFAGGPKPWNINPWRAKNFYGIPQWWEAAKKEGFISPIEYVIHLRRYLIDIARQKLRFFD